MISCSGWGQARCEPRFRFRLQERWVRPVILAATAETASGSQNETSSRSYNGHVFTGGYEQWVNGHNYPKDGCLHRGANGKCLPDWM